MFEQERRVIYDHYGLMLWKLRNLPSHSAHWIAGVYLPPHERLWLAIMFSDYKENNIVASRGTSKSFTHASLAAPLYDALHKNSTTIIVSASGFRGGKLLFDDIEKLFKGQLRSQIITGDFLTNSVDNETKNKVLTRQPDMWYLKHRALGRTLTIPTNNADAMRGIRATTIIVDERNTFDGEVVQKVIRPMLNVGKDFKRTATGVGQNKMFQVSTIDYTFRDWHPEITTQTALAEREYDAQMARKSGDWELYDELMNKDRGALKTSSFSISRVDYTDLLIPAIIQDRDGEVFDVEVPLPPGINREDVCVWDYRDDCHYWYMYPVDKKGLEDPYLDGTMDEDLWLAEQRNVFISAAGNVYPHDLVVKTSDRPIYQAGKVPGHDKMEDDFYAPIMYRCGDPCVIGADYARESDEFALVVIRLGQLADTNFDPWIATSDDNNRPFIGKTDWSNVIWAESWRHMTASEAADKIRQLRERYNIINVPIIGGGIGMDKQGGGTAVRDQLAIPKPPVDEFGNPDPLWVLPTRIYDPMDEDYAHYANTENQEKYWSGLELIKPTNQSNLDATMASKAMLQKLQMYIGYYEAPSQWAKRYGFTNSIGGIDDANPMYHNMLIGYKGVLRLKSQLVRLQSKVTETGVMRFVMPGKKELEESKKDMYSAFIYACYMARKHLVGITKEGLNLPPQAQPILVQIGSEYKRGSGNTRGRNASWREIGWGTRRS